MLTNLLKLIKEKKVKVLLLIIIFVGIITTAFILIPNKQKGPSSPKVSPTPTTTPTPAKGIPPGVPTETKGYFLNVVKDVKTPVTGYSWISTKLVYSTNKGIYMAGTNTPIVETPISYISWSNNGFAVYQSSDGGWFFLNGPTETSGPVTIKGKRSIISPTGERVATLDGSILELLEVPSGSNKSTDLKTKISTLKWSLDGKWLGLSQETKESVVVYILDTDLEKKRVLTFEPGVELIAVSPNANRVALYNQQNLKIYNVSGKEIKVETREGAEAKAVWINENDVLLTESVRDDFGRKIDYISRIDNDGKKDLLADSRPILKKIDTSIMVVASREQTVLPLVENKGTLWLLALIPGKLPVYTAQGLSFFPISTKGL